MKNTLYIAAAGAGKTTYLVKEALKCDDTVLITTFTQENEKEIRKKFVEINNGIIPSNVTIQTWFSFLIEHGAKPYQGTLTKKKITGLILVNEKSGLKHKTKKYPIYYKESETDKHFFSSDYQIYSDKLSKFAVKCNSESKDYVIERISSLFKNIFIDEVQDLAGYDLEIVKLLLKTGSTIKLAGDPRQVTYHTHFSDKYKKYKDGKIMDFIETECASLDCSIDNTTLQGSWRNNKIICNFANKLFSEYPKCESFQTTVTGHDGVFLLREKNVPKYLNNFSPLQLRYDRRTKKVDINYNVKNFGESKGSTHDRILIFPTKKMLDWIVSGKELEFEIKCKFYVAITRAKYSVCIVCSNNFDSEALPFFEI